MAPAAYGSRRKNKKGGHVKHKAPLSQAEKDFAEGQAMFAKLSGNANFKAASPTKPTLVPVPKKKRKRPPPPPEPDTESMKSPVLDEEHETMHRVAKQVSDRIEEMDQSILRMFCKYDADNNLLLDQKELTKLLRGDLNFTPTELPAHDVAVLWKFIDSDHSGAISSQELTTFLIRCEREVERTDTRRAERDRRKNRPKKAPKKAKKARAALDPAANEAARKKGGKAKTKVPSGAASGGALAVTAAANETATVARPKVKNRRIKGDVFEEVEYHWRHWKLRRRQQLKEWGYLLRARMRGLVVYIGVDESLYEPYLNEFGDFGLKNRHMCVTANKFLKCDTDRGGTVSSLEWLMYIDVERTSFSERVITLFDDDESGEIDYLEWTMASWNMCTAPPRHLAECAFTLYKDLSDGLMHRKDVDLLLVAVFGEDQGSDTADFQRERLYTLCTTSWSRDAGIDLESFAAYCHVNPSTLRPAFDMQMRMRRRMGGVRFWRRLSKKRAALFGNLSFEQMLRLCKKKIVSLRKDRPKQLQKAHLHDWDAIQLIKGMSAVDRSKAAARHKADKAAKRAARELAMIEERERLARAKRAAELRPVRHYKSLSRLDRDGVLGVLDVMSDDALAAAAAAKLGPGAAPSDAGRPGTAPAAVPAARHADGRDDVLVNYSGRAVRPSTAGKWNVPQAELPELTYDAAYAEALDDQEFLDVGEEFEAQADVTGYLMHEQQVAMQRAMGFEGDVEATDDRQGRCGVKGPALHDLGPEANNAAEKRSTADSATAHHDLLADPAKDPHYVDRVAPAGRNFLTKKLKHQASLPRFVASVDAHVAATKPSGNSVNSFEAHERRPIEKHVPWLAAAPAKVAPGGGGEGEGEGGGDVRDRDEGQGPPPPEGPPPPLLPAAPDGPPPPEGPPPPLQGDEGEAPKAARKGDGRKRRNAVLGEENKRGRRDAVTPAGGEGGKKGRRRSKSSVPAAGGGDGPPLFDRAKAQADAAAAVAAVEKDAAGKGTSKGDGFTMLIARAGHSDASRADYGSAPPPEAPPSPPKAHWARRAAGRAASAAGHAAVRVGHAAYASVFHVRKRPSALPPPGRLTHLQSNSYVQDIQQRFQMYAKGPPDDSNAEQLLDPKVWAAYIAPFDPDETAACNRLLDQGEGPIRIANGDKAEVARLVRAKEKRLAHEAAMFEKAAKSKADMKLKSGANLGTPGQKKESKTLLGKLW